MSTEQSLQADQSLRDRGFRLHAQEYEVVEGHSQFGRGDLWFTADESESQINLVVEVKAHSANTAAAQAAKYGAWVYILSRGRPTYYATYVGSTGGDVLTQIRNTICRARMSHTGACRLVLDTISNTDAGRISTRVLPSLLKSLEHLRTSSSPSASAI